MTAPAEAQLAPARIVTCSAAELARVRAVVGRPVGVADVRAAITRAARQAYQEATAVSRALRSEPRSEATIRLFRGVFNVPPGFVPRWRPLDASWRDLGELVAIRFERAATILSGGYMHFFCWGSVAHCPECAGPPDYRACSSYQGRHYICLGTPWWEWFRDGGAQRRGFMASTLLHEALHIYFRLEHHRATIGRPSVNNMYCYDTLLARMNGRTPKPCDAERCRGQACHT